MPTPSKSNPVVRIFAIILLGLISALGTANGASAMTANNASAAHPIYSGIEDFSFESFEAKYALSLDEAGRSHARVTETLVAIFPEIDQNRGIVRRIPVWFKDVNTRPTLESVTDQNGTARNYEILDESDFLAVKSIPSDGSFVHGRQTYVFTYTLDDVIGNYQDSTGFDEFYWDVNGVGWPQSFGLVKATVVLDSALTDAYGEGQVYCYQGAEGSADNCDDFQIAGANRFEFTADSLGPNETLTIAVPFKSGTVIQPDNSYFGSWAAWPQLAGSALVLIALGWAIFLRFTRLKDAEGRNFIITEYQPPKGASLAQGAVVTGAVLEWVSARITQLAIEGYLSISAPDGLFATWNITRTDKPLPASTSANSAEAQLAADLDAIFGGETTVALGRRSVSFAQRLQKYSKAHWKRLWTTPLFRIVPFTEREYPIFGAIGGGALTVLSGMVLVASGAGGVNPLWISALTAALTGITIKAAMKRPLSAAGSELRDHLDGLEEFIELAEKDRIAFLQSPKGAERVEDKVKLYEPLLPWAILLGLEAEWSKVLGKAYEETGYQPIWFAGAGAGFKSDFSSFTGAMSNASSTGGSSGSGSAGGGGGGGGGGGA